FLEAYQPEATLVVDPFAGEGHLLRNFPGQKTLAIDIDPQVKPDVVLDSFTQLGQFAQSGLLVVTNPPFCYRHVLRKQDQGLYRIVTDAGYFDLYEYSIRRVIAQLGFPPIFTILPENFVASRTARLRPELYEHIRALQIHSVSTSNSTAQPTV